MNNQFIYPQNISKIQLLFFIFLVLVLPSFLLIYLLYLTYSHEIEFKTNAIKTNLISEATRLLVEFRPENLIDATVEQTINKILKRSYKEGFVPYISSETINFTINDKNLERIRKELYKKLSIQPVALLAIGSDLKKTKCWLNSDYLIENFTFPDIFIRNLFWLWLKIHSSYFPFINSNFYKSQKKKISKKDSYRAFETQCRYMIKTYFGDHFPKKVNVNFPNIFYSTKIRNKKIWFKIKTFEISKKNKKILLGALAVFYALDDIPLKIFIKNIKSKHRNIKFIKTNSIDARFLEIPNKLIGIVTLLPTYYQIKYNQSKLFAGDEYDSNSEKIKYLGFIIYKKIDAYIYKLHGHKYQTIKILVISGLFLAVFFILVVKGYIINLSIRQKFSLYLLLSIFFPLFISTILFRAYYNLHNSNQIHLEVNKTIEEMKKYEASYLRYAEMLKVKIIAVREKFLSLVNDINKLKFFFNKFLKKMPVTFGFLILRNGDELIYESKNTVNFEQIDRETIDKIIFQARTFSSRVYFAYNHEFWEQDRLNAIKNNKLVNSIWSISTIKLAETIFEDLKSLKGEHTILDSRLAGIFDRSIDSFLITRDISGKKILEAILFVYFSPDYVGYKYFSETMSPKVQNNTLNLQKKVLEGSLGFYNFTRDVQNNEVKISRNSCFPPNVANNRKLFAIAQDIMAQNISDFYFIKGKNLYIAYIFQSIPYIAVLEKDLGDVIYDKYINKLYFIAIFSYGLVLIIIISNYLDKVFSTPIFEFVKASQDVAQGNYNPKIQLPDIKEYKILEIEFSKMCCGLKEGTILRRFVPNEVLNEIEITKALKLRAGGENRNVAIIFSHIKDFDQITIKLGYEKIFNFLNMYFTAMENAIKSCQGSLDKYISDAIMAVFYEAPNLQPAYIRAWKAACKMRKSLANFNLKLKALGVNDIKTGISLCYGNVISGKIGSNIGFINYTVIGDTVNLAARLENLRSLVDDDEVITDEYTASLLKPITNNYRFVGEINIKGKIKPVNVYAFKPQYE